MKSKKYYKYINLLVRLSIGIAAVYFIYINIKDNFFEELQFLKEDTIGFGLLLIALLLVFFNWGIEAFKWKYVIKDTEKITFKTAFKHTLTGITLSILTPNRIGEIPARAVLLNKDKFKELTLKTLVSSYSQMLITLLAGLIGYFITMERYELFFNLHLIFFMLLISLILLLLIYFRVNKIEYLLNKLNLFKNKKIFAALSQFSFKELLNVMFLSLLRYGVFFLQFYLVLKGMGISLISIEEIMLISVCFLFASFIPTILISEIGVRGSVAIFVFGTISDMDTQIILSSVLLWVINVALPALIGLSNLKSIKLIREN